MLTVGTKADLVVGDTSGAYDVIVSVRSGQGIDDLISRVAAFAAERARPVAEGAVPTRQRHVDLVVAAVAGLEEALDDGLALELRAEGLRVAGDCIGRLTGEISPEEVLGEIFAAFCIGK